MFNRLTPVAHELDSRLGRLPDAPLDARQWGQHMTGSGSAHFVLCRDSQQARAVATTMHATELAEAHVAATIVRS